LRNSPQRVLAQSPAKKALVSGNKGPSWGRSGNILPSERQNFGIAYILVMNMQLDKALVIAKHREQLAFIWAVKGHPVQLIETNYLA